MGSSRFLPLVVAGLIGLFVGWLFGPDVDDVTEAANARFDQLDARIAEMQAPVAAVQTSVAAIDQRTSAIEAEIQAMGNPAEATTALSAKLDAVAAATGEGKAATDGLGKTLSELQTKLDAMAAAPAPAAAAADKGAELASQIGNTGAILLPGQTAIFGNKRLTLASLADGTASMGAEGSAPSDIATGASIDLGNGCNVALVGVTASAAYLAPTGCAAQAAAPAAEPAAPAAPAAAEPAAAPAAAPAPAPAAPAPAEATADAASSDGKPLTTGQTGMFGDKRAFLSRVSASENKAFVFVPGKGQVAVAKGEQADLGDGCMLTLGEISDTTATFTAAGCGGDTAANAPAPTAEAASADDQAAPAAAPAATAEPAATEAATTASADGTPLSVGQTGTFGDKRAFLSRVSADDNKAFIFVPGKGQVAVASGEQADLGDGCILTLTGIDGANATFASQGCGGETAAAPAAPATAAPAEAAQPAPAAPAAAPAEAPAAAEPAAAPASSGDAPAPTQATAGGAAQLTIGQTATFGDKRVFLSRVSPEKAFVVVVGQGNKEVAKGAPLDLGGGCTATYDGLNDKTASFTPAGC